MIEVPLLQFCKLTSQSRQIVTQKIKTGKIKSRKDENGRVFVLVDFDLPGLQTQETHELNEIKDLFQKLFGEYKIILGKLEEKNKEIINSKDEQIKELKEELTRLKSELEKKDKSLFRRLFGG